MRRLAWLLVRLAAASVLIAYVASQVHLRDQIRLDEAQSGDLIGRLETPPEMTESPPARDWLIAHSPGDPGLLVLKDTAADPREALALPRDRRWTAGHSRPARPRACSASWGPLCRV
ncbi:MAG: hypothetical protein RL885_09525 [Planctomycetota bacterium]